ncbi:MAG TPA: LPS export ABC transporter permease LptG [Burkholderiales bacterium]|nr:LPS export ABC transporter permease LptG [Burkholderiales bacterium]
MRTLRRYMAREIIAATALVMAGLLVLFAFFDLVEQIKDLGRGGYQLRHIILHVLLSVPNHVYELFPIATLIGTLFALAQLVASSQYTVMRVSGISISGMAMMLGAVGMLFAVLTFLFGEFIGPPAEQLAQRIRSQAITGLVAQEFRSGLWIKDGRSFINVFEVLPDSTLRGVKIYEFDDQYRLRQVSFAQRGDYQDDHRWLLQGVVRTTFEDRRAKVSRMAEAQWQSVLEPRLFNILLVKPEQMSAWNLYSYSQHLKENRQKALRYEIALWNKAMYPGAVLVMMLLALPFAQSSRRQGGVGGKVFAGIMLGLGFHLLNRLFGHLGLLNDWPAAVTALVPPLIFLSVAVALVWWQERR